MQSFDDPRAVADYRDGPPRLVPGFADLQRMALLLLGERTPDTARILVVGAGGGLELRVFAGARPGWRFDGVDPSRAMLDLARDTLGPLIERVDLHEGTVDAAPAGPFDGASCLLVLHFLSPELRRRTLAGIRQRLRPGAPFVAVHISLPAGEGERRRWLSRSAAFAVSSGVAPEAAGERSRGIETGLPFLAPEQDEAMLREAGFVDVELFYAALEFRGWVARAPG